MIKTDKVVYRTRTLEEYDWLMKRLEEAVCKWYTGRKPTGLDIFYTYKSDTCIFVEDKKLTYTNSDSCKNELDYEIIEVSDLMENEIKTDKVIYHTKTQEEYDWLMEQLQEAGCEWQGGGSPICGKEVCDSTKTDSYICVENGTISFLDEDYVYDYMYNQDYELIEVSDLMENEKKTEILDKLETMNKYLDNKLNKLEEEDEYEYEDEDDDDESQKIKKIVYTTEVYFE